VALSIKVVQDYQKELRRRIQAVLGSAPMLNPRRVTLWSVLHSFHLSAWNTAWAHGNPEQLTQEALTDRWNRGFQYKIAEGMQSMQLAMESLGY
jgi:hypothetical protein